MKWHIQKQGIKPHIKKWEWELHWWVFFMTRLEGSWICLFMKCVVDYESWKTVYMWLLRTFKMQRIISTALPKVFEMHRHNGYET